MSAQRPCRRGRANAAALLFLLATFVLPASRVLAQSAPSAQPFVFAGLSLETTRAQLRQRYPQDYSSGNTLDVAPERVQDHIRQIEIATPDGSGRGRLRLSFERPALVSADGRVQRATGYPRCAEIEKRLKALFGAPTRSDEYIEGDTDGYMNRILVWERRLPQLAADQHVERLNLQCGRSKGEKRFWAFSLVVARSAH